MNLEELLANKLQLQASQKDPEAFWAATYDSFLAIRAWETFSSAEARGIIFELFTGEKKQDLDRRRAFILNQPELLEFMQTMLKFISEHVASEILSEVNTPQTIEIQARQILGEDATPKALDAIKREIAMNKIEAIDLAFKTFLGIQG